MGIFIEAQPPRTEEMQVEIRARGMRSSVLQRVADVEGELRRFVAEYVIELLDKPHVLATRTIDVCGVMDGVWAVIATQARGRENRTQRAGLNHRRTRAIQLESSVEPDPWSLTLTCPREVCPHATD